MTERERRQIVINHLRAGNTQDAAEELASCVEAYPGDGDLHHAIGLAFAAGGTLGPAREQLETAAKLSPHSAPILADLAQVWLAQGRSEEAVERAEQALVLDSESALAHFTLGRAYLTKACAQQSRSTSRTEPGYDFPLIDGRAPLYLRALTAMEAALDSMPPFVTAVRAALAFAYVRAGHLHAAAEQLAAELAELPPDDESERVADRLRSVELEIARERYWTEVGQEKADARDPDGNPELLLRAAHAHAVAGDEEALAQTLAQARAAGYGPRPAVVTRFEGEDSIFQQVSDVHLFIAGGLECVLNGELRFLPFGELDSIQLGPPAHWRAARVELLTGESLQVEVPALYRLSLRSSNDFVQSGRFTQFKYNPGETRYARAIGSRNLTTEDSVIPFTDMKGIRFL